MERLPQSRIDELLENGGVMRLACVDDRPYVTALSFVHHEGQLFFRSHGGRRVNAIRNDPRVAIEIAEIDSETGSWASVTADGTARFVESVAEKAEIESMLIAKYADAYVSLMSSPMSPPLVEIYVVAIELANLRGRASGSAFGRKTRPGRF